LRAEKTANLIYNGGKTKKPAEFGEVSIYFDNTKKVFPTEEDNVKISRIIKPSGQSVYKINDKTRTRMQILDLLSIAKINPDGYNIILQGDIVKLVEMSPVERRGIIEEIAGISVYEERKNKALRDLERVQERINEAEIILKERDGYLKDLKKDRDQAIKYKDLNDKITTNKASYLKHQLNRKESQKQKCDDQIDELTKKLDTKKEKIKKIKLDVNEKKKTLEELEQKLQEKGQAEQITLQKQIEKLRVEIGTAKNKLAHIKAEQEKLTTRKEQLSQNRGDINQKLKTINEDRKSLDIQKKKATREVAEYDAKISAFKKKHKIDEDKASVESKLGDLDGKIEVEEKIVSGFREQQQELLREKDKYEFQIQSYDERIKKVLAVEKENQAEIKKLKQMKSEFKKLIMILRLLPGWQT